MAFAISVPMRWANETSPSKISAPAAGDAALSAVSLAHTQRAIRRGRYMIVGYAPGGTNDISARLMGQWLSERLGQQFIIENRPGAASNLATEAVVNAPPDGYTLLLVSPANAINATLYDKLNFDFIRDIAPVAAIMRSPTSWWSIHPSGQNGPGVHRLCQSQSGQAQHGIGRRRKHRSICPASCSR